MENYGFSRRNGAIDMLRGLTMFLMIFVNDFWTVGGVPHWLEHTATNEDGMGLADIVFPLFLFVVGLSIPYAIERRFQKLIPAERPSATSSPAPSPCWSWASSSSIPKAAWRLTWAAENGFSSC